ncbi:hypothetical protein [Acidisphaera sp. L21]|uniref:hypothetical protein n=1 Tax=Acidisphaera sp. L21 TaxID=1641851 RepID=UPI00131E31C0|nr:hypothetical protein [Acidisphaera sp. L21]
MASLSTLLPDAQSRSIVREFLIQTAIGSALMLALFAFEAQTLPELGQAAVRVFSFYSIIDCVRASLRREPVWAASLNRWDQAAAYAFCAMVLNVLLDLAS